MFKKTIKNLSSKENNNSLSKMNHTLYEILNNKEQSQNLNIDTDSNKIFNFYFILVIKTTKIKDIKKLLKINKKYYKKNKDHIIFNVNASMKKLSKVLLTKLLSICIINSNEISPFLDCDKKIFIKKLFELIQIYYLNGIIDKNNFVNILKYELIKCFNKEANSNNNYDTSLICNMSHLECVINCLLSFKTIKMNEEQTRYFLNIIEDIAKIINELFLYNYNNLYLLSNYLLFYRLIELSQISLNSILYINPILMKVYKFNFKIDYYLNDLSEQFTLKKEEFIIRKNNNIIAKNNFLYELFKYETLAIKEQKDNIIKNGFVFNDNTNNGIILCNNDSFNFPNKSFSSVISFKLIKLISDINIKKKDNKNNKKDNKIYPIYSLSKKDGTTDFNIYIENNILKMNILGKAYELFKEVEINKAYVLWHFHYGDNKHGTSIFYLNDKKAIFKKLTFHNEFYNINIGFNRLFNKKDKSIYNQNNFIGIIGTYILFNNCFIKDEKSEGSKFYEQNLIGLKCNYEDIIYINYKTEFSSLNSDILNLLNKFSSDDISRFIEVIISSKSIISDNVNYFFKEKYKKSYKANYFMDKNNDKSMIYFNSENDSNNYKLVTYPIHFINTFDNFINNNGIKFLTLELYYFIGIIGSYSTIKNEYAENNLKTPKNMTNSKINEKNENNNGNDLNNKIIKELKKEKKSLYLKLQHICNLFLYCLQLMNEAQEKQNENDINNFFDTLNNLISLNSKNNFKIDYMFLSSIMNNLVLLINKKLLFKYFGFIFEYDSYEPDDEKVFQFLFRTILIYLDEYNTNFLTSEIFLKILNFDKLYIENKASKKTTKIYSQLIRECLSLSLLNNNDQCFMLYIQRLKSFTGIIRQNDLISNFNYISEEELSEESDNIYTSKKSSKLSSKNIIQSKNSAKISLDERIKINELNNLKLTYKYMKNLYLCLGIDKQAYDIFVKFCLENGEKSNNFFNEEFKILTEKYEINKFKYQIKNSKRYESGDYIDRIDDSEYSEKSDENNNIIINKEKEEELKIAELIKSLCIRFLDEINYDNNFKIINSELKDKKNNKDNSSLRKSVYRSISSFSLVPTKKNLIQKSSEQISSINLSSAQNLAKKFDLANDSIESILTSNFEFFNNFTLSPYTFNSFFLSMFRNLTNKEKIKYIKNINKKSEKLYLDEKIYIIIRFYNRIILKLIQRVGDEESDTFFLGKLEFFEYVYDKFYDLLLNMLDYFDEKDKNKKGTEKKLLKSMINNLFCSKENAFYFYISVFKNLKKQKEELGTTYVVNSQVMNNNKDKDKKNEKIYELFFEKVKKNINNLIDRTIFKLIDPFYFKLLFEIYINDYIRENEGNKKSDLVLEVISNMITKFDNFGNEDINKSKKINKVYEFNNKNSILLIYKITFYISKRQYLIQNTIFIKSIVLYLITFLSRIKLVFLKLVFSIDDTKDSKYKNNKKMILEMLFEIFIELYLEFKKISNEEEEEEKRIEYEKEALLFEEQIMQLLLIKNSTITNLDKDIISLFDVHKGDKGKKNNSLKFKEKSICYLIDELSIMISEEDQKPMSKNNNRITLKYLSSLRDYVLEKYQKEYATDENDFSVTILFLIKLTFYIKKLEKFDKDSNLLNILIKTSEILCKDAQKLQQKFTNKNPLGSKSENQAKIYDDFKNYIINEYNLKNKFDKDELMLKIKDNKEIQRYNWVEYSSGDGRLSKGKSHMNIAMADKRKAFYKAPSNSSLGDTSSFSRTSLREEKDEYSTGTSYEQSRTFRINSKSSLSTNELPNLNNNENFNFFRVSSAFFLKKKEKNKFFDYKIVPKFSKYFVRNHFSLYFLKLLTYDEDFINLKKIYYYIYNKEIADINKYNLNYPSRLKNRLANNYTKHFLKKDINFFSSQYFKYSHKCINEKNFVPKSKILFPPKTILEKYDFAHKDIIINKDDKSISSKNCELITYEGAIFGYIYLFQNCILFKSDIENDKRKVKNLLDCACCCMEFDFLEINKKRIIELTEIKEVICRKFLYSYMSLEIFMKNGYSHLFNFFSEEANYEVLDILKNYGIPVIKNVKEYFDKENFIKKWKEGKISTYNYLLILNKFASRTYNDSNQYPIMPWIFMEDKRIRNFDIPMSVQDEEAKERYLKIPYNTSDGENRWHSNHYSTSAYICYYLMRTNPYTESMIKFQSNNFDVPDRQFFDIRQTLILCEKNNNNREPIPELYTIPEVYINLNNNDFGKQSQICMGRIHNVEFSPYAENAYDFIYKFKYKLNNDEEVNTKINEWFDFIFGINQYNKDNKIGKGLRNFNGYSYGQNIDIKRIINDLKRSKKPDSKIYDEIKQILGMVISFGQCPFQLLSYEHPKRTYTKGINDYILSSMEKITKDQDLYSNSSNTLTNASIDTNENKETFESEPKIMDVLYDDKNKKHNIIYFRKSINNNNLYCICNNKEVEVYQKDKSNEFKYTKKIDVSKNYLLYKKNNNGYPILRAKYLFCELKEENFIFCRYLDNSIKFILPNIEFKFVLDSFITCIIRINEKEFITGDNKGKLCHWFIDLDDILNLELKLIKKINSNKNAITSLLYNERLNIIMSSDNSSVIIRSFYDFEFLTFFDVEEDENDTIVDIKVSNYDLIYVLINKGNDYYKLKGYSLNGICFGEYNENIINFELTEEGKIIVLLAKKGMINVLNPINFKAIYYRFIIGSEDENEFIFYHFYYEKPNMIYFGIKDNESSKIKICVLNSEDMKNFI